MLRHLLSSNNMLGPPTGLAHVALTLNPPPHVITTRRSAWRKLTACELSKPASKTSLIVKLQTPLEHGETSPGGIGKRKGSAYGAYVDLTRNAKLEAPRDTRNIPSRRITLLPS